MSDSAVPLTGQRLASLIERRQGKSAAHHMSVDVLQPNAFAVHYSDAMPKLETVSHPGKELPHKENKRSGSKNRREREFEELKGFMELGFVFSKDQLNPRLLSLLPGLKQSIDHQNSTKTLGFQESALEDWELPNPNVAGVDNMKEHLKLWARSVASTLKCYYLQHVNMSV